MLLENLGIPVDDIAARRVSEQSSRSNGSRGLDDDNFIPVALDPIPRPPAAMRSRSSDNKVPTRATQPGTQERTRRSPETFNDLVAGSAPREGSKDRDQISPHTYQHSLSHQSGSERVTGLRRRNGSINVSPSASHNTSPTDRKTTSPSSAATSDEHFKLHDVPKTRRRSSGSKRGSKASNGAATSPNMVLAGQTDGTPFLTQETNTETAPASVLPSRKISVRQRSPLSNTTSASSQDTSSRPDRPQRTDSLTKTQAAATPSQAIPRKQVPRQEPPVTAPGATDSMPERQPSDPALSGPHTAPAVAGKSIPSSLDSDAFEPPPRSSSRPTPTPGLSSTAMNVPVNSKHVFTSPREAPQPPSSRHKNNESLSSIQSEHFLHHDGTSLTHTAAMHGETSAEDEFGRMGPEEDIDYGVFRKVSKVMRHGRSYSDKTASGSPRFTKSSRNGSIDISSPMMGSSDGGEDNAQLRNKLRFSQQRILDLEAEKNTLQEQVNGAENIRQVNIELREKRSTMTFLDTQREMVVRELETMTEQLARAKEHDGPIDIAALQNDALRDFARQVQKLKESLTSQIEGLMQQKNDLTTEITNLIQMKDKGFQEYESLSMKNEQLKEHNSQLVASIQDGYRLGKQPSNALGISTGNTTGVWNPGMKDRQGSITATGDENSGLDLKSAVLGLDRASTSQVSTLSGDTDVSAQAAAVLEGPRVVDMRKGAQKKFSWKKGPESVAKNMKKGFKGAFASAQPLSQSSLREESFSETAAYGQLPAGEAPVMGDRPVGQVNTRNGTEAQRQASSQGWGFLGQKPPSAQRSASHSTLGTSAAPADTSLFGSDLTARCTYEGRVIPALISRCIDEVESRGMDVEGIYRKSGSYSQVKAVQQGFEKEGADYDIHDEDLDIHAVTSALKQYLRKLPTPLITYEAYDEMIAAATAAQSHGDDGALIEGCTRAIDALPEHHRNTLEFLIGHLARVMEREMENKVCGTFDPLIGRRSAPSVPSSSARRVTALRPMSNAQC